MRQENPRHLGNLDLAPEQSRDSREPKVSPALQKNSGQESQIISKPIYAPSGVNEGSIHVKFQVDANKKTENLREVHKQSSNQLKTKPAEDLLLNKTSLHEGVKESQDPSNLNLLFKNTSTIEPLSPTLMKKHSTNQSQLIFRGSSYENIQSHTLTNLDYFDAHNTSNIASSRNKKKGNNNQQFVEFGDLLQNRGRLCFIRCVNYGLPGIRPQRSACIRRRYCG